MYRTLGEEIGERVATQDRKLLVTASQADPPVESEGGKFLTLLLVLSRAVSKS